VTNLISNAFKFTKSGSIEVRVRKGDGACTVEVEDTGIGIPAGKLSSVFEPFEQARVYDPGTGLGLSIVREYALAMGFELDVKSIEGEKTCFMLRTEKFRSGEGIEWVI
jgi:signal transduction histidine kinase